MPRQFAIIKEHFDPPGTVKSPRYYIVSVATGTVLAERIASKDQAEFICDAITLHARGGWGPMRKRLKKGKKALQTIPGNPEWLPGVEW